MADFILDVETIGVVIGIVFFTALMLWMLARMSRFFEYLKLKESQWMDRDTLDFVHRVLTWVWVGMIIIGILFLAQFRSPQIREFIIQVNLRWPALFFVVLVFFAASVASRVLRRFAVYLRDQIEKKPTKLAPQRSLSVAEGIIRMVIWVLAAFVAYAGGVALLPSSDQAVLAAVLPRLQLPSAATAVTFGLTILVAFFVLKIADSFFDDLGRRARFGPGVAEGFRSFFRIIIYIVSGFVVVFLALDLALDPNQLATFGIFMIAFGLILLVAVVAGLDVIRGSLAGLSLMMSDSFGVGDRIRVDEEEVVVESLSLTATQVRNLRGELTRIPNTDLMRQNVVNLSRTRAVSVEVSVRADVDVPHERVEELLLGATEGVEGIQKDPAPRVFARGIEGGSIAYDLVAHVNGPERKAEAKSRLIRNVQARFLEAELELR